MSSSLKSNFSRVLFIDIFIIFIFLRIIAPNYSSIIKNIPNSPRELKVRIFEDLNNVENGSDLGILKLNISWLPPATPWLPTSYSILINTITTNEDNSAVCADESLFYTIWDINHLSIELPKNEIYSEAPELTIRPNCTYEIQVFANPRLNANSNVIRLNVTIPTCTGRSCNCQNLTRLILPPNLNVEILESNDILIQWNIDPQNYSNIVSYIIRLSVPMLISNNGLPIYSSSEIAIVPANTSFYLLSGASIDLSSTLRSKISMGAIDAHGCFSNTSEFFIERRNDIDIPSSAKRNEWSIIISVMSVCSILVGLIGYLWNRNCDKRKFFTSGYTSPLQGIRKLDDQHRWISSVLKEHNALYMPQDIKGRNFEDTLEISYNRLNVARELGKGQFAKVYLGYLDGTGDFPVAIKMLNPSQIIDESEARQQLLDEIVALRRAGNHRNLIKLVGYCFQPESSICIVLEYLSGGDLLSYLHRLRDQQIAIAGSSIISNIYTMHIHPYVNVHNNNDIDNRLASSTSTSGTIEKDRFIRFIMDIVHGMEHLEQCNIVHRDLAARNILISSNLTLKISDFGLARDGIYMIGQSGNGIRRLPVRWMAPETLRDRLYTSKSDVWSYAIVLWEIATLGAFPYSEIPDDKLWNYIVENKGRLKQPNNISPELYDLMKICWSSQSENRPTFTQIRALITNFSNNKKKIFLHQQFYYNFSATLTSDSIKH